MSRAYAVCDALPQIFGKTPLLLEKNSNLFFDNCFYYREIHNRLRTWQGLEGTSLINGLGGTLAGSVSGHSGSQHSSTGPSNNTGSTNLSTNNHIARSYHSGSHSPAYSTPYQPLAAFPRLSTPSGTQNSHPGAQQQQVYLRSNALAGSPVTIRINQPNQTIDTQLANL